MSMKPGATVKPAASIVRRASPTSRRSIATIRSPSTATSAAQPGAPLPSTTVPFLIRSVHAILLRGLDDLHRLHLVSDLDLVHVLHAQHPPAEDRVLAIQRGLGAEGDVELAPRRVGGGGAGHGQAAAQMLLLVELGLNLVARAARAVALRIPALGHEPGDHATERK